MKIIGYIHTDFKEKFGIPRQSGLVRTPGLNEQDEACDLNCVPNTAVKTPVTLALSNSLGFGGHNACLAFRKVR